MLLDRYPLDYVASRIAPRASHQLDAVELTDLVGGEEFTFRAMLCSWQFDGAELSSGP
jgi:hypothetical protein